MGRYGNADEAYRMAISHGEKEPGEQLAVAVANYGVLWSALGDARHARALYEDALKVLDEHAPDSDQRAWVLMNLGGALRDAGELIAAVGALEQALDMERRSGARRGEVQALLALSDCHQTVGDLQAARGYANDARTILVQDAPRSEMHVRCLRQIAELATGADDDAEALNAIREAADLIAAIAPQSRDAIDTGCYLAALQCGAGQVDEGIATARAAQEAAERLRSEAPTGITRQTLTRITGHAADVYAAALMLRAAGGPDARAFINVLEQRHARRLVDQLGAGSMEGLDARVRDEVHQLREARRERGRVLLQAHWALQEIQAGRDAGRTARARAPARSRRRVEPAACVTT
jgi:tetratricopeptide (TPR) repeat protein